jgi:hypothetical protein
MVRSRLPRELLNKLDEHAAETGTDRPGAVRSVLREWRGEKVSGVDVMEGWAAAFAVLVDEIAAGDVAVRRRVAARFDGEGDGPSSKGVRTVFAAIAGALRD